MRLLKDFLRILWHRIISISYPYTPELWFPIENWEPNDIQHLQEQQYSGQDWGKHLGEDCLAKAGTSVLSIGRGRVVYSAIHASQNPPEAEGKKGSNWGNIIIIAHKNPKTKQIFFSVYGHLEERLVKKGDRVIIGQRIGSIAKGWTKENGWWLKAHLHFAIFIGHWKGLVLPGAFRDEKRTKIQDWLEPTRFIKEYV